MKTNVKATEITEGFTTHEGAPAVKQGPLAELRRAVSCCMLFESTFYESGSGIAARIKELAGKVSLGDICELAIKARTDLKLRHAPLYLLVCALSTKGSPEERNLLGTTIGDVIRRADELAEIIAIYWKEGKKSLPRQLKRGIALAFRKFGAYGLAKYNRDSEVKLRDALFLSHAKPKDEEQAEIWKKLIDGTLEAPDTWEVALSTGENKKATWERLIREKKLGYMALLRNLRNMLEVDVDLELIKDALAVGAFNSKALPFRFLAAAEHAPAFANTLSEAMISSLGDHPKLVGPTAIVIDVSGSMTWNTVSARSKMTPLDAASCLAVLVREICDDPRVFQFGDTCREVESYRGLGLMKAIQDNKVGHGTNIAGALAHVRSFFPKCQRVIMITDMQTNQIASGNQPWSRGYYLNVQPYAPALPTQGGKWTFIDGFSERVVDWIMEEEKAG